MKKQKETKKVQFNFIDFFSLECFKTAKTKNLEIARNYIKKKISLDHILQKQLEFEKLKITFLDENTISGLKLINKPNASMISGIEQNTKIQKYLAANEFDYLLNYEDDIESIISSTNFFKRRSIDKHDKKILDYIQN